MANDPDRSSEMDELTADRCWALLREVPFGRLAVVAEDGVDIFPVNHVVDHGTIVFRTARGTKLDALDRGDGVAFEIDGHDDVSAWSVVVRGRANSIALRDDIAQIFDLDLEAWHESEKPTFVRLEPTTISGRRFARRPT